MQEAEEVWKGAVRGKGVVVVAQLLREETRTQPEQTKTDKIVVTQNQKTDSKE